jgi:hypothetical protein
MTNYIIQIQHFFHSPHSHLPLSQMQLLTWFFLLWPLAIIYYYLGLLNSLLTSPKIKIFPSQSIPAKRSKAVKHKQDEINDNLVVNKKTKSSLPLDLNSNGSIGLE